MDAWAVMRRSGRAAFEFDRYACPVIAAQVVKWMNELQPGRFFLAPVPAWWAA